MSDLEKTVMSAEDIRRATSRIAHEIVEKNKGSQGLVLIGILTRGVPLAKRLAGEIQKLSRVEVPVGELNIVPYRDDLSRLDPLPTLNPIPAHINIAGKKVVLVDDVLYTGRSTRSAMDALTRLGRPGHLQLAVLIDRGHREMPIRPDYVGKNIPTAQDEDVEVRLQEIDGRDEVVITRKAQATGTKSIARG